MQRSSSAFNLRQQPTPTRRTNCKAAVGLGVGVILLLISVCGFDEGGRFMGSDDVWRL
jgi:hypothetical protein